VPFGSVYQRDIHFQRHGAEFGAATQAEYEAMADLFTSGPMNADSRDCTRHRLDGDEDYVRMDLRRTDFGVNCANRGFLRTFYRPDPGNIRVRGGCSGFLVYQCARVI